MNLAQALAAAPALGLDRLDAQLLLLHVLGRAPHDRAWLLAHDSDELNDSAMAAWTLAAQRRAGGEPLAYITGHKEFFGLDLLVDARVLVPRPDTETLVEWALDVLAPQSGAAAIDLGCGSGAIALALKATRPDVGVSAVDASGEALALARANAQRLGLDVHFSQGDWLAGITRRFDLIASNPPYVAEGDPHLIALTNEPERALTSGIDGLDDIRRIIQQAPACLHAGGWLLLEHGYDQADAVRGQLTQAGFAQVQSRRDLAGIQRCSGGQWPEVK
jgi:release factor glutamine methyltransferase